MLLRPDISNQIDMNEVWYQSVHISMHDPGLPVCTKCVLSCDLDAWHPSLACTFPVPMDAPPSTAAVRVIACAEAGKASPMAVPGPAEGK